VEENLDGVGTFSFYENLDLGSGTFY